MARQQKNSRSSLPRINLNNLKETFWAWLPKKQITGPVAAFLVFITLLRFGPDGSHDYIQSLSYSDVNSVKEVFTGGNPWLIACTDANNGKIPDNFVRASASPGPIIKFASIDCSGFLPSGKTVRERFNIEKGAPAFLIANGADAITVPIGILRDIESQKLVKWALAASEPQMNELYQSERVHGACFGTKKKVCAIVFAGSEFAERDSAERRSLTQLMRKFRTVQFAYVNSTRSYFTSELTGTKNPGDDFPSMFIMTRKNINETESKTRMGFTLHNPTSKTWVRVSGLVHYEPISSTKETADFIESIVNASPEFELSSLTKLDKLPLAGTYFRPRTAEEKIRDAELAKIKAEADAKAAEEAARGAGKVLTDEEVAERKAQFKKNRAEKERKRREQLESEGADILASDESEPEQEGEEEVESIDL